MLVLLLKQAHRSRTMHTIAHQQASTASFELLFQSFGDEDRGMVFPCDAAGRVDMDQMSDATRNNYLFARALMGRDFTAPMLRTTVRH
jgi:hypothetical protein